MDKTRIEKNLQRCTLGAAARQCDMMSCSKCGWRKENVEDAAKRYTAYGLVRQTDGLWRIATDADIRLSATRRLRNVMPPKRVED